MTISIFLLSESDYSGKYIAERTAIGSPFLTTDPTWTLISTTTPLIGAPTCPGSVGSAFGLAISSVAVVSHRYPDGKYQHVYPQSGLIGLLHSSRKRLHADQSFQNTGPTASNLTINT